jgi:hypothetical protein
MTGRFAIARQAASVSPAANAGAAAPAESTDVLPLRADGLVGVYAHRVLDRGGDLRAVAADARAARCGPTRSPERPGARGPLAVQAVGRGTERHRRSLHAAPNRVAREPRPAARPQRTGRRLVAAGLAVAVMLPIGALLVRAEPANSVATMNVRPAAVTHVAPMAPASVIDLGKGRLARVAP